MSRTMILMGISATAVFAAVTGFHVLKEVKVGGEGGWDYLTLDSAARRLYVSHATHVEVIDPDQGKVVGDIPDTPGVHGIALAPELNRGFISNGRGNNVTIFDLKTLQKVGQVATGQNPDAIQFEPISGRVFTFNGRSNDSTAFDAKTGKVEKTFPMGGKPEFSAADGKGNIYVNIEDTSELVEVDASTMTVKKRIALKPCDSPSGLAMDVKNRRIFSVCENKVMVITDPDAGKVITTVPIGEGADGAAFDPVINAAFSSNGGSGNLTVVSEITGKWQVSETVPTKRGGRTIAVDTKSHQLYIPTAQFGPPAAPAGGGRPRPSILPDTFEILVVGQ